MLKLYHSALKVALGILPAFARFSPKLRQWLDGRKNWEAPLVKASLRPGAIWFHAASSGEFEQAIPLIEWLKLNRPSQHFVISFFSPSGYSMYHQYPGASAVFYLPPDFPENNERLLELLQPSAAIFIKYEIWPGLFKALNSRNIPLVLVAARFHPGHFLLKRSMKGLLGGVTDAVKAVGAQDHLSVSTMVHAGFRQVTWCGDTRFDRVRALSLQALPSALSTLKMVNVVAGSTWEKDDEFLSKWLDIEEPTKRLLVFPHELDDSRLNQCLSIYERHGAALWKGGTWPEARVIVVGLPQLLSRAYRLGKIAWIGGGFNKGGIHNCLEAAVYGIPVCFGPFYQAYPEAVGLVEAGGGKPLDKPEDFSQLMKDESQLNEMSDASSKFMNKNEGATQRTAALLVEQGLF
jgi:3-deoxy-D-manno-octulosonic-acid transferase